MFKFLIKDELHACLDFLRRNKIKHMPIVKVINRHKYKYLCEVYNQDDLFTIRVGLHDHIELIEENEKFYRPGHMNL